MASKKKDAEPVKVTVAPSKNLAKEKTAPKAKKVLAKSDATEVTSAADALALATAPRVGPGFDSGIIIIRARTDVVKIAGLDSPFDEANPLCDHRIHRPWFLDESMVQSIADHGQEEAGEVVERDGVLWANVGRRRLAAMREAEKREPGREFWYFFTLDVKSKTDADIFARRRRSNGQRRNDDALTRALDCERARELYGITLPEFARNEGISEDTQRSELALIRLAPEYQVELELDTLPKIAAIQVAKSGNHAEQRAIVTRLRAAGHFTLEAIRQAKKDLEATRKAADDTEASTIYRDVFNRQGINDPVPAAALPGYVEPNPPVGSIERQVLFGSMHGPVAGLPAALTMAGAVAMGDELRAAFPAVSLFGNSGPAALPQSTPAVNEPATETTGGKNVAWSMTEVRKALAMSKAGVVRMSSELHDALSVLCGELPPEHVTPLHEVLKRIR